MSDMPNGAAPGTPHDDGDECVDPGCDVTVPHSHSCSCCGPGTYLLPIPDPDQTLVGFKISFCPRYLHPSRSVFVGFCGRLPEKTCPHGDVWCSRSRARPEDRPFRASRRWYGVGAGWRSGS